jgi:outer membrane biogenesis lipoprotein LolB
MSRSDGRAAGAPSGAPFPRRAAAAALAALLGVAGCAIAPPSPPEPPAGAAVERDWAGRFSVNLQSNVPNGRNDAAAGRFTLSSRGAPGARAIELELVSPFGQTLARGRREPGGASSLVLSDGRTLEAATLDALVERALGWPLPVERLPDWLDDRFQAVLERDAAGRPAVAQDSGWRIEREPRRWSLQRPQGDGVLRVVLVLDR